MDRSPQQTVKIAIDCETGELLPAEMLLHLSDVEFATFRRQAMEARLNRKHGGDAARFRCAICKHPLYLSRWHDGELNRWFVHDGKSESCPWYEHGRLTPDQTKALIYRGQQEGAKHQEYKQFLASWLGNDPLAADINQEKTTFSQVVKGEWRRPDVKCIYEGHKVVFEVQLSYTFLSDVIARDAFYQREGIHIIWVFAAFDINRAAVADEAFFNRRNVFVLDKEAMRKTAEKGVLTFNGYRQVPRLVDERISDIWTAQFVTLQDVRFPLDTYRPFFFDYDAAREVVEQQRLDAIREPEEIAWRTGLDEYIARAMRYYESDYSAVEHTNVLRVLNQLRMNARWHKGLEVLANPTFFGFHGVLAVLLSIKLNRPVSYSPKLTVFRVIEAGLRFSHHEVGKHAYAILFLWAYKVYRPPMTPKNEKWLSDYAHKLKTAVDAGDRSYRRHSGYDKAISELFPELAEKLATGFGC